MKAILVENPGKESRLVMDDYETPVPTEDELLVQVHATALNRADLLQRSGNYPVPPGASPILGLEMAGVVEQVGNQVEDWSIGGSGVWPIARRRICRIRHDPARNGPSGP